MSLLTSCMLFISTALVVTVVILTTEGKSGLECDQAKFYSPYAIVRRRKNGGDLNSLDQTGFLDLSSSFNIVLCLNGPAIALSNYEEVENGTVIVSIFSSGKFQVYSHTCLKVNRITEEEIRRLQDANLPLKLTKDVAALNKVVGVNLVGEVGDYRKSTSALFIQEKFGHSIHPHNIVHDGSFAVIGNSTICYNVNNEFQVMLTSKAKTLEEVCLWTIDHNSQYFERYQQIFRANRDLSHYVKDTTCNLTLTPGPLPNTTLPITPKLIDPFSILFGHKNTRRVSRSTLQNPPIMVEYKVELEDCKAFPTYDATGCIIRPPYVGDKPCDLLSQALPLNNIKDLANDTDLVWKKEILNLIPSIFVDICEAFPPHISHTVHRILEFYLELEHKATPTLRKHKLPIWSHILADLHLCKANTNHPIWFDWMVEHSSGESSIHPGKKRSRYVRKVNDDSYEASEMSESEKYYEMNGDRDSDFTTGPISRYPRETDPIPVPVITAISVNQSITSVSIRSTAINGTVKVSQAHRNQEHFTLPIRGRSNITDFMEYPLNAHHLNQTKFRTKLFYYEDTAEIEYELNIGIDIAWKIWATVAGYCSQHYITRKSETFARFYNQYFEDFLQPVYEDWISPQDNEVLRVILGDYNSDVGMRWLDSCLEGSYVDSDTRTFRPPRPLLVRGDKAQMQKANSFLDTPTWLESNMLNQIKPTNFRNE